MQVTFQFQRVMQELKMQNLDQEGHKANHLENLKCYFFFDKLVF